MKQYEQPTMNVMNLEAEDVITLSIGKDDYDPTIDSDNKVDGKNPWQ